MKTLTPSEIRHYTEAFFHAYDCMIIDSDPSSITVRLSKQADKDLGNRPFYWSYIEKMGIEPNPLELTFVFDRNPSSQAEELRMGSRRLQQIFDVARQRGRFVRMYEHDPGKSLSSLIPWLNVNYRVAWICDKKKERLVSCGFNLRTGTLQTDFQRRMQHVPLVAKLPHYQYVQPPTFSLNQAHRLLENDLRRQLEAEDRTWADNARQRWKEEQKRLDAYYQEDKDGAEKQRMDEELRWQYEPRITVRVTSGGLFYLSDS